VEQSGVLDGLIRIQYKTERPVGRWFKSTPR